MLLDKEILAGNAVVQLCVLMRGFHFFPPEGRRVECFGTSRQVNGISPSRRIPDELDSST